MTSRRWAVIAVLSVGHFLATTVLFFAAVGDTMSRFDRGVPASAGSMLLQGFATALRFPLGTVAFHAHWMVLNRYDYVGWTPLLLNSLLWGTALYWSGRVVKDRLAPGCPVSNEH